MIKKLIINLIVKFAYKIQLYLIKKFNFINQKDFVYPKNVKNVGLKPKNDINIIKWLNENINNNF